MDVPRDRHSIRRLAGVLVDLAGLDHAAQDVGSARVRPFDARYRIVPRRGARQPRDQRRLGQGQVRRALVEVDLGGSAHAIRTLPEEDAIQVLGEDFLLAELALDPQREEHFLELAAERAFRREERIARELHRDRAPALAHAACRHVGRERAHEPLPVDARVLEEPVILGGEERIHHHLRDVRRGDRDAALLADLGDQLAVTGVHGERKLHAQVAQLGGFGQVRFEVLQGAGDAQDNQSTRAEYHREQGRENFQSGSPHS